MRLWLLRVAVWFAIGLFVWKALDGLPWWAKVPLLPAISYVVHWCAVAVAERWERFTEDDGGDEE